MTRLILTNDSSAAGGLKFAGRADIAIPFERRLGWGRAPTDAERAAFFRGADKPARRLSLAGLYVTDVA
jgi:hypothetical protein